MTDMFESEVSANHVGGSGGAGGDASSVASRTGVGGGGGGGGDPAMMTELAMTSIKKADNGNGAKGRTSGCGGNKSLGGDSDESAYALIPPRPVDRALMAADRAPRPLLRGLHSALLCGCCKGYLINAVKLDDCLHSFCRSCLVQYISSKKKQCPTCVASGAPDKTYPLLEMAKIVLDPVLQSCVYKLVPGLYRREQQRVNEFYLEQGLSTTHQIASKLEGAPRFLCPDELISLSLEYEGDEDFNENKPKLKKRYLQCPAAVTINHIEKLLRLKYSIYAGMAVVIRYKKRTLKHQLSLMDVVYIYGWQRDTPMEFFYRITRPSVESEVQNEVTSIAPKTPSKPPSPPAVESKSTQGAPQPQPQPQPTPARPAGTGRMIYDPEKRTSTQQTPSSASANMQPRVELTEYARNIGLTAVKNGSSQYDFREDKDGRDDDQAEFALRRDREWAAQKQQDERQNNTKDDNVHRKRKKAKHSKNEDSPPKRRKLHAQITSPESSDDALKMKVKLTPTPVTKHKHKHHSEHVLTPTQPAPPITVPTSTSEDSKSLSTKEKLLQMRAVRRDKHKAVVPVQKTSEPTAPIVSIAPAAPSAPTAESTVTAATSAPAAPACAPAPSVAKPVAASLATTNSLAGSESKTKCADIPPAIPLKRLKRSEEVQKRQSPPVKAKLEPKAEPLAKTENSLKLFVVPKNVPHIPSPPVTEKIPNLINTKPAAKSSGNAVSEAKKEVVDELKVEVKTSSSKAVAHTTFTEPVVASTPKVIRPPPATIPLVRIKKSVNKTVTFSTPDKISAQIEKTVATPVAPQKTESGNPMCDNIGALDLSGKSSRSPTTEPQPASSPSPPAANRLLNGVTKVKKPLEKPTNVNPMSNLQMLSESAVQILSQSKTTVSRMPIKQTIHNTTVRPSVPMHLRIPTPRHVYKPMNPILKLNEIKGPRSINPRPQNQTVRSIPNPSALTFRPTQAKQAQDDTVKQHANSSQPPTSSASTDIKKIENLAKNLNIEKVTAELVGRAASEANKINVKVTTPVTTQMTTP